MSNPSLRIALVLLVCLLAPGFATAVDLFAAETEVADEGSDTRNKALAQMLGEVLVRVSGNTGIAALPAARPLLDAAPSLAQQYRYRSVDGADGSTRFLSARFDQGSVESMMRTQGLPVWTQRPRVLMWVATEQRGERALLNLEERPAALAALQARADRRGMPLQLPLSDIEDQTRLTPADIWSGYEPALRLASARYPHDVIVGGRLVARGSDRWAGSWLLMTRDGTQTVETPPLALPESLAFAVDQVQNLLAAQYAPIPGAGSGDGTLVRFSGIYGLDAYGWLVQQLEALPAVSQVALREVDGDRFTFELGSAGLGDDLRLALDSLPGLYSEPGAAQPVEPVGQRRTFVPALAPRLNYRVAR
ncbi:MAG: DUF2066 domain-containing protein [Chromatiaceae bacterium]|nr:DUF2066 domain-containing protein [Chromatiaceae bacterium]MCP5421571.1 DUF2066 domain-containing protein [Chromatiaceae bacterium]